VRELQSALGPGGASPCPPPCEGDCSTLRPPPMPQRPFSVSQAPSRSRGGYWRSVLGRRKSTAPGACFQQPNGGGACLGSMATIPGIEGATWPLAEGMEFGLGTIMTPEGCGEEGRTEPPLAGQHPPECRFPWGHDKKGGASPGAGREAHRNMPSRWGVP